MKPMLKGSQTPTHTGSGKKKKLWDVVLEYQILEKSYLLY